MKHFITSELFLKEYMALKWGPQMYRRHKAKRAESKRIFREFSRHMLTQQGMLNICAMRPVVWDTACRLKLSEEQLYLLLTTGVPIRMS